LQGLVLGTEGVRYGHCGHASGSSHAYTATSPRTHGLHCVTWFQLQSVADAHPWPEMQRFDFLVRTRSLTDEEAQVYRETLGTRERDV
jgi:hypothetical protein